MNTDKIYAEQLANEYAPKDTSKVIALRKLDARAKLLATVFVYTFGIAAALVAGGDVPFHAGDRQRLDGDDGAGHCHRDHRAGGHGRELSHLSEAAGEGQEEVRL